MSSKDEYQINHLFLATQSAGLTPFQTCVMKKEFDNLMRKLEDCQHIIECQNEKLDITEKALIEAEDAFSKYYDIHGEKGNAEKALINLGLAFRMKQAREV